MNNDETEGGAEARLIKHDIKNQLSNIALAIEQLKYEIPDQSDDCRYYIETIFSSCKNINVLLNNL